MTPTNTQFLHSTEVYTFYLTPTRFGTVAIFNDLAPKFHKNTQQYIRTNFTLI